MPENLLYDNLYYRTGCGKPYVRNEDWLSFFQGIADHIKRDINPGPVLDAGCALGFLVETLRNVGVEAEGIDISEYAISQVHPSIASFCSVGSITEPFKQKYSLIVTIEVVEHLPGGEAEKAIRNICAFTDDVLFSSSPIDYKELTHFNVKQPEAWAELFAREGFYRDQDFDAAFLTPWAVRFRRSHDPAHRIVMGYERKLYQLMNENLALRQLALEQKWLQQRIMDVENESMELNRQMTDARVQLNEARFQNEAITKSMTYRLAGRLRKFWPKDSLVEKVLLRVLRWIKSLQPGRSHS